MIDFSLIYRVKRIFAFIGFPVSWLLFHFIAVIIFFLTGSLSFLRSLWQTLSRYLQTQKYDFQNTYQTAKAQSYARVLQTKASKRRQTKPQFHFPSLVQFIRFLFSNHSRTITVYHRKKPRKKILVTLPEVTPLPKRRFSTPLLILGTSLVVLVLGISLGSALFYRYIWAGLPTPDDLRGHKSQLTTKIYDRNHVLLYKIYKDENRTLVQLNELPAHLIDATIAIEDKEFYSHHGVSLRGLARAFRSLFEYGKVQGGSTITQQLIKNTLLSPERTFIRKAKEMIVAIQVERSFTKDEILEMYFNEVAYGGSVYGIEEASRVYFGKSARELTLAQSAYLAGLPAAPSIFSPFGPYPEQGTARMYEVLRRMTEDGKISPLQAEQAKGEPLVFASASTDIKAPHFVMYIKGILANLYGEDLVSQGGLEVITTLDLSVQEQAQQIVTQEVDSLQKLRVSNGAALITNPKSGEILAMVGSRNYFDTKRDGQVNVTIRPRQPGSSIKPLTYATSFERGMTPSSLIEDAPITYSIAGSPPYSPKNYDGRYHGKVTIRQALANSYNIPAVKTLASIGVQNMVEKGKTLGITTWNSSSRYGLALTLGGGEVLMTDMSALYSTFANLGETVPLNPIIEVKLADGKTLYKNPCIESVVPCGGRKTLDPRIAYQITNILSDNQARSQAFGLRSVLTIPDQEVAVKTGTTNGLRDNWTFGYTTDRLVSVWVGNNDNSPMSRVTSGITGASPIWNKLMKTQLSATTSHRFQIPDSIHIVKICPSTGKTDCGGCPSAYTEYFLPGTEPTQSCEQAQDPQPQKEEKPKRFGRRDQLLEGVAIQ